MTREARLVDRPPATVIIGGGQGARLRLELAEALAGGAAGVVSFGLCGGLAPGLAAGDVLVESNDRQWLDRLGSALAAARPARIVGADRMIARPSDKASLHARTEADAVDMESHIVRDVARCSDLPWAVIRAVSDPVDRALPRAALAGLKPNGKADVVGVLAALARRPWELPALLRTAADAGRSFKALADARDLLGVGLGCPYLVEHLVDVG